MALAEPKPADAGGQALKRDPRRRQIEPAMEMTIFGK